VLDDTLELKEPIIDWGAGGALAISPCGLGSVRLDSDSMSEPAVE
jgi:hypothetical protein